MKSTTMISTLWNGGEHTLVQTTYQAMIPRLKVVHREPQSPKLVLATTGNLRKVGISQSEERETDGFLTVMW